MPYSLLADLVLLLHLVFILFVVFGGLLVIWRLGFAWLHIPCAVWGVLIEFRGWVCPLTYLENDLRAAANTGGYAGGFIEHYLIPIIYPSGLTSGTQVMLGSVLLVVNAIIYTLVWRKSKQR